MQPVALCYIRKSSVRSATDLLSPERQRATLQRWCEANGYRAEYYEDAEGHKSGRREAGREGWQSLLEQLHRPEVRRVVVATSDRSHRNLKELLIAVDDRFAPAGVTYVALDMQIDTSTAMGRMMLQASGMNAELWANVTSEKMKAAVEDMRSSGVHWGTTPFGTTRDEANALVPNLAGYWARRDGRAWCIRTDEPEGEGWEHRAYCDSLRCCYEYYADDRGGYGAVADLLAREGWYYAARDGEPRPWGYNDVRRTLQLHQTYAGHLLRGATGRSSKQEVIVENAWPPILPPELLVRVQGRMARHKKGWTPRGHQRVYILTPLLHCRACGARLEGNIRRDGVAEYRHYRKGSCRAPVGRIPADELEATAMSLIAAISPLPADWPELVRAAERRVVEHSLSDADRARLLTLRERLRRLADLYLDGALDWNAYQQDKARTTAEIAALEALEDGTQKAADVARLVEGMRDIHRLITQVEPPDQRRLVPTLFARLDVDLASGDLYWYPAGLLRDVAELSRDQVRTEGAEHGIPAAAPGSFAWALRYVHLPDRVAA